MPPRISVRWEATERIKAIDRPLFVILIGTALRKTQYRWVSEKDFPRHLNAKNFTDHTWPCRGSEVIASEKTALMRRYRKRLAIGLSIMSRPRFRLPGANRFFRPLPLRCQSVFRSHLSSDSPLASVL